MQKRCQEFYHAIALGKEALFRPKRLSINQGFVAFGDYFDRFSIQKNSKIDRTLVCGQSLKARGVENKSTSRYSIEFMKQIVALFGEAEKGAFKVPHRLGQLPQLVDLLGNPPADSEGLFFAIQAILYNREIIFFRVAEEGFSRVDYLNGLKHLKNRNKIAKVNALCLPGVGDPEILAASEGVCHLHKSFLITNQKDLYDFLTSS